MLAATISVALLFGVLAWLLWELHRAYTRADELQRELNDLVGPTRAALRTAHDLALELGAMHDHPGRDLSVWARARVDAARAKEQARRRD